MNNQIVCEIPYGFKLGEHEYSLSYAKAKAELLSAKCRRLTSARKCDGHIILTKHYYTCPKCGYRIPAYSRYIGGPKTNDCLSVDVVNHLCNDQLSLFEDELNFVEINAPVSKHAALLCPQCHHYGPISQSTRECRISYDMGNIVISYKLVNICELLSLQWLPERIDVSLSESMYEALHFDFESGTVYVKLTFGSVVQASVEVNNDGVFGFDDPLENLIEQNRTVHRLLIRTFEEIAETPVPFSPEEINLDRLILMTHYVGYNYSFYNSVPLSLKPGKRNVTDDSFGNISAAMHKYIEVPLLYESSGLPHVKSIRKLFFETPELFFYIREAEKLWKLFNDMSLFWRLLSCDRAFEVLAFLHRFENIITFLSMLSSAKGKVWLCRTMMEKGINLLTYGIPYSAMSEYAKNEEQQKWSDKNHKRHYDQYYQVNFDLEFSVPLMRPYTRIPNCRIGKYHFHRLTSTLEQYEVGNQLQNCLAGYRIQDQVIAVYENDLDCVAAIELIGNRIMQAQGKLNKYMSYDDNLNNAFMKWCAKFNLAVYDHLDQF